MEQWISEELSKVLEFEVAEDLIKYIMSIESEPDFNEYMKTLLDFDNPQHRSFFMELVKKKFPSRGTSVAKQKKKISKNKQPQQDFVCMEVSEKPADKVENDEREGKEGKKKKTKFVNLYSKEGKNAQVVLLKGRHRCDCEASKHELVNNCLDCGRIVCAQEGSGPCLFCGSLVCTEEEENAMNSNTRGGSRLKEQLLQRRPAEEKAVAHMQKLLDYQKNSEKLTQIVDDDCDYFNTNSVWLSTTEKEKLEGYQKELHEKKHTSRLNKKVTFDFAGRQIVEEKRTEVSVDLERIKEITNGSSETTSASVFYNDMLSAMSGTDRDVAPGINPAVIQFKLSAEATEEAAKRDRKAGAGAGPGSGRGRVQDSALQEMTDAGRCLSMHQPWASLLVEGIKLHEGRTWYTSHRGRLWIASTAKPPDQDTIRALENQYRLLYPEKNLKFPSFYPTGCLLGCVNVDDCLPQEEYEKKYPGGESDSPFVFICSSPVSLRLRFPVQGQHKIYQLDKTIHKAAVKCIQNMPKSPTEEVTAG